MPGMARTIRITFIISLFIFMGSSLAAVMPNEITAVTHEFEAVYSPMARKLNLRLKFVYKLNSPVNNVTGIRQDDSWVITFYGGMMNQPTLTKEGLRLIVCHEFGHILGGEPSWTHSNNPFSNSNSGQPDYYAASLCMKLILANQKNDEFYRSRSFDKNLEKACSERFHIKHDVLICLRTVEAGLELSQLLAELLRFVPPDFLTPDQTQARVLKEGHPSPQCRLDTFLAGALCNGHPGSANAYEMNEFVKVCDKGVSQRPACWFPRN
jgi:hypothetical protein